MLAMLLCALGPRASTVVHWINDTIQQISVRETNYCVVQWIEIYPVDSAIHRDKSLSIG